MTSVSSPPWSLEDPEPQDDSVEQDAGVVPARMAYDFTWDDVVEVLELYLDLTQEDGYLVLVGRQFDEEHVGTLFWSGPTLHGVIWRGRASDRSPRWREHQQARLRARLEKRQGGAR